MTVKTKQFKVGDRIKILTTREAVKHYLDVGDYGYIVEDDGTTIPRVSPRRDAAKHDDDSFYMHENKFAVVGEEYIGSIDELIKEHGIEIKQTIDDKNVLATCDFKYKINGEEASLLFKLKRRENGCHRVEDGNGKIWGLDSSDLTNTILMLLGFKKVWDKLEGEDETS